VHRIGDMQATHTSNDDVKPHVQHLCAVFTNIGSNKRYRLILFECIYKSTVTDVTIKYTASYDAVTKHRWDDITLVTITTAVLYT